MRDSVVEEPKPDKDLPEVEDQPDKLQAEELLVEPSAEKQKLAAWWKNIKVPEKLKKCLEKWDNMKVSLNCSLWYFFDYLLNVIWTVGV